MISIIYWSSFIIAVFVTGLAFFIWLHIVQSFTMVAAFSHWSCSCPSRCSYWKNEFSYVANYCDPFSNWNHFVAFFSWVGWYTLAIYIRINTHLLHYFSYFLKLLVQIWFTYSCLEITCLILIRRFTWTQQILKIRFPIDIPFNDWWNHRYWRWKISKRL